MREICICFLSCSERYKDILMPWVQMQIVASTNNYVRWVILIIERCMEYYCTELFILYHNFSFYSSSD